MAKRRRWLATMIVGLVCGTAGRSIADGKPPRAVVPPPASIAAVELSHPVDPAFYRFTGHPVIRAWSSVPRRT